MGLTWDVPPTEAIPALVDAYVAAIRSRVRMLVDYYAAVIEAWMKENAPWTDRTSNARQTLAAQVEELAHDMLSILLAGGVDYFVYLELGHQGRYAIIAPALDRFGPMLWADLRAMLS